MEFAPDGTLMLCTREGEVWKYLIKKKQWSLFADGLHESLGLWIDPKTSETFVIQRGEITKLVDTNGDGRADLYESFNAGWGVTDNYHEYAFGFQGLLNGFIGVFWGTLLAVITAPNLSLIVGKLEGLLGIKVLSGDIYFIDFLPSQLQANDVLLTVLVAIVLSVLATLYPAQKAAAIQPARALH